MTDTTLNEAWQTIRELYPGLNPDSKVLARASSDDEVEVVAFDWATEALAKPERRGQWLYYKLKLGDDGEVLDEKMMAPREWEDEGFSEVEHDLSTEDLVGCVNTYLTGAGNSSHAEVIPSIVSRLNALLPELESALRDGQTGGFPDKDRALQWLSMVETQIGILGTQDD